MDRRIALRSILAAFVLAGLMMTVSARAEDAKEVTLKGTLECAKCELKETKKCCNVLIVKDGDKEVRYYLKDNKVAKEAHEGGVCKKPKEGASVTGTVEEKDGKKILTATKID